MGGALRVRELSTPRGSPYGRVEGVPTTIINSAALLTRATVRRPASATD